MKKRISKILSIAVAAIMILSLAACSKAGTNQQPTANPEPTKSSSGSTKPTEGPTQKEPSTISVLMTGDNTPAPDNIVLKELSKRTNVNVDMIYISKNDLATKISVMTASDTLPDVFPLSGSEAIEYRDAGLIANVEDLLKEYGPNILANLGDSLKKAAANKDGIYLILDAKLPYCMQLNMRTDWLKNLGMELPTDLDSLYEVYYAFTYNDPDKDGKDDTFGLAVGADPGGFATVFGAYGIPVARNSVKNILLDDKITIGQKHPHYLEAIEYIRKLIKDGLVEPDWGTIPNMDMFSKLWNGIAGAIEWECVGPTNNWMPSRYVEDPAPTFDFPVIVGPYGDKGTAAAYFSYSTGYVFNAKCKDLASAIRLCDYCMTEEGNELLYLGIENVMYKWINKEEGTFEYLGEYKDTAVHRAAGGYCYATFFAPTNRTEERILNKQTREGVAKARALGIDYPVIIQPLQTRIDYGSDMDSILQEMYVNLLVTEEDVKTVYDRYIAEWEKAGGLEWEKEATEQYWREQGR